MSFTGKDATGATKTFASDTIGGTEQPKGKLVFGADGTATDVYDADGNRLLTIQPGDVKVYTPFAEYEETVTSTTTTQRSFYYLAGQLIAARVKTATTDVYTYAYADHLGSIVAWSWTGGTPPVNDYLSRYDPFGGYRTKPATTVNPDISDRGFTGHKQNNTGSNDLGLIYMNARYYLPEVGRFVSADTIVPEAEEPQSYNRYAYANNSPVNFTDPTGHCTNNYEAGSADMDTCVAGWNAVVNYLTGAAYCPGCSGNFPNELVNDWLLNADIGTLENLMEVMGIDYGYTWTPPQGYAASGWRGGKSLRSPEFRAGMCDYWQSCYDPVGEYATVGINVLLPYLPIAPGAALIQDDWGNIYVNFNASTSPGVGAYVGSIVVVTDTGLKDIEDLAVDQREAVVERSLSGVGMSGCAAFGTGGCVGWDFGKTLAFEGGVASPGTGLSVGKTFLIYDKGSSQPWSFPSLFD